jgi:dTDP-4-dehydrorhamnose reductase
MTRLLVTGASGYLGSHVLEAAVAAEVWATSFSRVVDTPAGRARRLDLRDGKAVRALAREIQPSAILHTACSNRSAEQVDSIAAAARNLALAARDTGAHLVHISTDLVFDGEAAPYGDDAILSPLSDYGRAKAEAEAIVRETAPGAIIVRPSLIWGLKPIDHQTRWLVDAVEQRRPVTLFVDEIRCPVHVRDLSMALLELAARPDLCGAVNLGGPQPLSRWDFGLKLLRALGFSEGPEVRPGAIADSGMVRARDLTMTGARARAWLRTRLRGVDEALTDAGAR